jgi:hypothetical protein
MAITFRGSANGTVIDGGTTSIDLTAIAGLAQNDVVVVHHRSSAGTGVDVSGWTRVFLNNMDRDLVAYKVMGGSPDTSISFWDTGGTSDSGAAVAAAFTGVDTATPLDVASTSNVGTDPPSIVPTSDDCAIVVMCSATVNDATPGTITNFTVQASAPANDTNPITAVSAYRILTGGAGGTQNPGQFSGLTITGGWSSTLALRPAGIATGQPAVKRMGGVVGANYRSPFGMWRELLLPPKLRWI